MKPTWRLISLLSIVLIISIVEIIFGVPAILSVGLLIILCATLLLDFYLYLTQLQLSIERDLPGVHAINKFLEVTLTFSNPNSYDVKLIFYDDIPFEFEHDNFPANLNIKSKRQTHYTYQLKPVRRGDYNFLSCDFRVQTFIGLLQKKHRIRCKSVIKIYPDYMPVIEYAMLKTGLRTPMMGIHTVQKRGSGLDFLELREYREGDSLRQIDWKSTSRMNKTISREYQVEQDQSFIFLLDCSHRMNVLEKSQTHFDYVLNAMLLTSYIALKQGDAVGFAAFGLDNIRWSKPAKGMGCFQSLLQNIYDIQPSQKAADYLQIAESIPKLYPKNATLILLTNLRDNDSAEISSAVKYLSRHYQVILASIKENIVEDIIKSEPEGFEKALALTAALEYSQSRDRTINQLKSQNIQLVDILADKLAISLANEYLRFKSK